MFNRTRLDGLEQFQTNVSNFRHASYLYLYLYLKMTSMLKQFRGVTFQYS